MPKNTFINLPDDKKHKIIEAAINEFSQNHYGRITIDNLVRNAGIPKGSFYQYFENKDDLYIFIFSQIGKQKKYVLESALSSVGQLDFKSFVLLLLAEGSKFETTDLRIVQLKRRFLDECPQELRKLILRNEFPESYNLLIEVINLYIQKGELRPDIDIETVAFMIIQCIANLEFFGAKENISIQEAGARTLSVLIEGIKLRR